MIQSRRGFLVGAIASLVAAPAIVRAASIMPVRALGDWGSEITRDELAEAMWGNGPTPELLALQAAVNKLFAFRSEITREYMRQNLFSPYAGLELKTITRVFKSL